MIVRVNEAMSFGTGSNRFGCHAFASLTKGTAQTSNRDGGTSLIASILPTSSAENAKGPASPGAFAAARATFRVVGGAFAANSSPATAATTVSTFVAFSATTGGAGESSG